MNNDHLVRVKDKIDLDHELSETMSENFWIRINFQAELISSLHCFGFYTFMQYIETEEVV